MPLKISDLNWERNILCRTHRMPNTDFGFIYENKKIMLLSERVQWSISPPLNPVTYIHTYINKSLTCQISLADVNCFLRYFYYMNKHHFLYFCQLSVRISRRQIKFILDSLRKNKPICPHSFPAVLQCSLLVISVTHLHLSLSAGGTFISQIFLSNGSKEPAVKTKKVNPHRNEIYNIGRELRWALTWWV